MIEHSPLDHTPLDVQVSADPSVRAELERLVERVNAHLARPLCRTDAPLRSPEGRHRVPSMPDRLVVDNGREYRADGAVR